MVTSDTPLTNDNIWPITFGYQHMLEDEDVVSVEFVRQLERAYHAACAFIDSHIDNPDLSDDMIRTYASFTAQREALTASLSKESTATTHGH